MTIRIGLAQGTRQARAVDPVARAAVTTGLSSDQPGGAGLLDDERGDHPEHAVLALGVREDVAVERPRPGLAAVDDDVPALARVDAQRVARERGGAERIAVAGDDPHRHPVEVPRMHHVALVHEPDDDRVAQLRDDRRRGREAAAVDREAAERVVADPDDVLGRAVQLVVALGRVLRLDDERAEQAAPDLVGGVVVRVVHVRAGRSGDELVGERLAGLDRLLGHVRHAVHGVGQLLAVEVDAGATRPGCS